MLFRALLITVLWPLLSGGQTTGQESVPWKEQTFAGPEMAGPVTALAVDDAGRVYLSCAPGTFGQGVLSAAATLPADRRLREDRAVFSLEDRRVCTQRWLDESKLKAPAPATGEFAVCLTDTNGDGRADQRTIVAEGFGDLLDGPAGGIAVSGGVVFFGCTPSLWRLEDDNGDLRADRRLPLQTGFGIRTGSGLPGLRAITEGPDGMIYFTTTDRGSRVQTQGGARFVIEDSGAVFRCRPDGSELELIATGLRDPAGIAVDLRGRIFVADASPDGQSTRLLYVLPGADFGWDATVPERNVFAAGKRPPWMLPEAGVIAGSATGLIVAPALMDASRLPSLLMADGRSKGGLIPVSLHEAGGGFTVTAETPLWEGRAVSGLAAAPDGALIWAERGEGPAGAAVCRVCRLPPREASSAWTEGAALISGGIKLRPSKEFPALLEHPHPLVRWRTRQTMTAKGFQESLDILTRTARRSPALQSRLNAVWGMASLAQAEPLLLSEITLLFTSPEPEIRALALRIAGEIIDGSPPQEILQMLKDASPDVRVEAAGAIARLRPPGSAEALTTALQACGDSDPFLRHALTYALSRVLSPADLSARGHASPSLHVRTAALNALRRLHAAQAADFLTDENPGVVLAAAEAIYDDMILPGYPPLAAALERCAAQPALVEPGFIKRALAAALRTGTAVEASTVAALAGLPADKLPEELRRAAHQTLAGWDTPPVYEPVHGRFDIPLARPLGIARPFLQKLDPAAATPTHSVDALFSAIGKADLDEAARIDALQQLTALQPLKALEVSRGLLPGHGTALLRAVARNTIMKLDPPVSYKIIGETLAAGSPQEMQAVLQTALRFDSKQAEALWLDLGKKYLDGTIDPAARLEVLEGLRHRDVATRGKFRRILEAAEANLDEGADPLARWHICETGGDPDKGRLLYETGRLLNCTECHSVRGRGGVSAPELDGVASRLDRVQLLASLVQPSSAIAQGYGHVTVTLQDGTHATGLLRKRDELALVLATRTGIRRLNADSVKSLSDPVSPMPSAAAILTPREIRDLVAWLATLK